METDTVPKTKINVISRYFILIFICQLLIVNGLYSETKLDACLIETVETVGS